MHDVLDPQWRTRFLPYDPGPLPVAPAPSPGEELLFEVDGLPPRKRAHRSLRNPSNREYERFFRLRQKAIQAMGGRAWYRGPVILNLEVWVTNPEEGTTLLDYVAGVMDTLGGSHGAHFTYLPVVFEDDRQVVSGIWRLHEGAEDNHYRVHVQFATEHDVDPP